MCSIRISLGSAAVLVLAPALRAGPVTFTDLQEFLAAAGDVHEIDFETLPDGSPSYDFAAITPEFNYTDQGVTFSSPQPELWVTGPPGNFALEAMARDTMSRNWIVAHFVTPAWAVGIMLPGGTTLSALDTDGEHIGSICGGGSGGGHFLGIVSDVPIATAIGDRGSSAEIWESFMFTPVPEPATLALLTVAAVAVLLRRK